MTMKNRSIKSLQKLIPWFLNNSLQTEDMQLIEEQIERKEHFEQLIADWRKVSAVVAVQPTYTPSPEVEKCILARLTSRVYWSPKHFHAYAILFALVILLGLWYVVKPGIVLEWSVQYSSIYTFHIYRAIEDTGNSKLIYTTTSPEPISSNRYVDMLLLPWQSYTYIIEGVQNEGEGEIAQTASGSAADVLPIHLLLLTISIILGYQSTWLILVASQHKRMAKGQMITQS